MPRFVPRKIVPTPQQTLVQASDAAVCIVDGLAGSAKTTSLALRIGEALAAKVPAARILALAFTAEARKSLVERLHMVGIAASVVKSMSVHTMEELGVELYCSAVSRVPVTQLADEAMLRLVEQARDDVFVRYEGHELLADIPANRLGIRNFFLQQIRAKAQLAPLRIDDCEALDDQACSLGMATGELALFKALERRRAPIEGDIELQGRQDAIYDLARALHTDPSLESRLPGYDLIICDELHDLSEAAFAMVTALLRRGGGRFVGAGDTAQVIFSALGSSPEFLDHRFAQLGGDVDRRSLSATFRHGPHLSLPLGVLTRRESRSELDRVTHVDAFAYPHASEMACAEALAARVQMLRGAHGTHSCAILVRYAYLANPVEAALADLDIPYSSFHLDPFSQRVEILFVRTLMSAALGGFWEAEELIRSALQGGRTMLQPAEKKLIQGRVRHYLDALYQFAGQPAGADRLTRYARDICEGALDLNRDIISGFRTATDPRLGRIAAAVDTLRSLPAAAPCGPALATVLQALDIDRLVAAVSRDPAQTENFSRSIRTLSYIASARTLSLRSFNEYLVAHDARHGKDKFSGKGVVVDLMENVKGYEFDHVLLPYLIRDDSPLGPASATDERNLFYVAASRAQRSLSLYSPDLPELASPLLQHFPHKQLEPAAMEMIGEIKQRRMRNDHD